MTTDNNNNNLYDRYIGIYSPVTSMTQAYNIIASSAASMMRYGEARDVDHALECVGRVISSDAHDFHTRGGVYASEVTAGDRARVATMTAASLDVELNTDSGQVGPARDYVLRLIARRYQ